jgi:hypothetical protein
MPVANLPTAGHEASNYHGHRWRRARVPIQLFQRDTISAGLYSGNVRWSGAVRLLINRKLGEPDADRA